MIAEGFEGLKDLDIYRPYENNYIKTYFGRSLNSVCKHPFLVTWTDLMALLFEKEIENFTVYSINLTR